MSQARRTPYRASDRADDGRHWVAVDAVAFAAARGELLVLVGRRQDARFGRGLVLPGGAVGRGEDPEQAARRHLANVGLPGAAECYLEQLHAYGSPFQDARSRLFCIAHVALVPPSAVLPIPIDAPIRWVTLHELQEVGSAVFTAEHAQVLEDGLARAAELVERTTVASALLDEPFSIGDLRRVYEAIWGCALSGANFRRKVRSIQGFVEPTGEVDDRGRGRTVPLYRRGSGALIRPTFFAPDVNGRSLTDMAEFFRSES